MAASAKLPPQAEAVTTKPYLLRAIYRWALDHHLTPQLLVDVGAEEVALPTAMLEAGRISLSIDPQAVRRLEIGDHYVLFSARFDGQTFEVCVPVPAVLAIYCRENGQGIFFHADGSGRVPPPSFDFAAKPEPKRPAPSRPKPTAKPRRRTATHLTLVK